MTSQQGVEHHFDALVIGSGLSGITYCLQLLQLFLSGFCLEIEIRFLKQKMNLF